MDQIRQIRFLIAPFFFYASLIFALWRTNPCIYPKPIDSGVATVLVAGIIPIGFFINSVSRKLLTRRWIERMDFKDEETIERIRGKLTLDRTLPQLKKLWRDTELVQWYLTASFDHGVLNKGIHEWILRSWSGFLVSVDSICALGMALLVGWSLLDIGFFTHANLLWSLLSALIALFLADNAIRCRRRCIDMLELQAWRREMEPPEPPETW